MKIKAIDVPLGIQISIVMWLIAVTVFLMTDHMIPAVNKDLFEKIFTVFILILNPGALGKIAEKIFDKETGTTTTTEVKNVETLPEPAGK